MLPERTIWFCIIGAAVVLLVLMAFCNGVMTKRAQAHEWYEGVKLWQSGMAGAVDCCGKRDCAPYPHRTTSGELAYEFELDGVWHQVPTEKIVGMASPDDQLHVCCIGGGCRNPNPAVRCVIIPGRGS